MSLLSDKVLEFLKESFGAYHIKKEHYVFYGGHKLFFDFFLPELLIAVEVQGAQHDQYVEHFHVDKAGFQSYKNRDRLKREWSADNDITLIEIRRKDLPLTKDSFFSLATVGGIYD